MKTPAEITATYNAAVSTLQTQLNANIKQINSQRVSGSLKQARIAAAIKTANSSLANLTAKYQRDLAAANAALAEAAAAAAAAAKKSAFLVGINYVGTPSELYGCINDTKNVRDLLQSKYGFTTVTLVNDETPALPTKKNILDGLRNLLSTAVSGDTVFFMYSGHGTCTTDYSGDEQDGQDELIVPVDATSIQTCILDDDLNTLIRANIKPGVKLLALFDSCFSGTVLDLRYTYSKPDNTNQSETAGDVFMISGCTDKQTSMDTVAPINGNIMPSGAMTYAFLSTIEKANSLQELITGMNTFLRNNGYSQWPLLSSGKFVDYSKVKFL